MFGRRLSSVIYSIFNYKNYLSLIKANSVYQDTNIDFFKGYILQKGDFPKIVRLKTPTEVHMVEILNSLDYFTINEVFCWEIYRCDTNPKVFLDLGSNIGVSEIYFLSRNTNNVVYGFEPVPHLFSQLQKNTAPYQERVNNKNLAVSDVNGEVRMGIEDSGRYGGIGVETGKYITVQSRNINSVLDDILSQHQRIDIIKIDIEGVEEKVINAIDAKYLDKINTIYVESGDAPISPANLKDRFIRSTNGGISKFTNRIHYNSLNLK
jgi:FkbM family methyltransferase